MVMKDESILNQFEKGVACGTGEIADWWSRLRKNAKTFVIVVVAVSLFVFAIGFCRGVSAQETQVPVLEMKALCVSGTEFVNKIVPAAGYARLFTGVVKDVPNAVIEVYLVTKSAADGSKYVVVLRMKNFVCKIAAGASFKVDDLYKTFLEKKPESKKPVVTPSEVRSAA